MRIRFDADTPIDAYMTYTFSEELKRIEEEALEKYNKLCMENPVKLSLNNKRKIGSGPVDNIIRT